jgi:hypothetical protein
VVRERSAKPLFGGSIPPRASSFASCHRNQSQSLKHSLNRAWPISQRELWCPAGVLFAVPRLCEVSFELSHRAPNVVSSGFDVVGCSCADIRMTQDSLDHHIGDTQQTRHRALTFCQSGLGGAQQVALTTNYPLSLSIIGAHSMHVDTSRSSDVLGEREASAALCASSERPRRSRASAGGAVAQGGECKCDFPPFSSRQASLAESLRVLQPRVHIRMVLKCPRFNTSRLMPAGYTLGIEPIARGPNERLGMNAK